MHKIILALAISVLAAGTAAASEKSAVMATVHQWVDGINKGDMKMTVAACADQTSIIDDIPPHEWHGAGACSKWMSDFDAWAKTNEVTDSIVTLSKSRHVDITADRAYVVVPVNLSFKEKGKLVKEPSAMVTFALQKSDAGWRITGWAWAD
jgi:hypothetical protein